MGCCPSKADDNFKIDIVEIKLKTINDVIPDIEVAVKRLKELDSFATQEATEPLETLVNLASISTGTLREESAAYLATLGYGELFVKITKSLEDYRRGHQQDKEGVYNLMMTQLAFWNFTDVCPALGHDLGKYGGVEMLLNDIDVLEKHLDQQQAHEYVEVLLGILHNAIHLYNKNLPLYREARAVEILTKLLKGDNMTVKMKALLVLAYCVDEEESGVLATAHGCVKLLTQMLNKAVMSIDHRAASGNSRFSAKELLDGLNRLGTNDDNKSEIHKEGGVISIIRLLQPDCSEEEQKLAAEALWNLSFVEKIRRNTEIVKCTPVLQELATSQNEGLREASTFALWEIKDDDQEVLTAPTQCSENPQKIHLPNGQHVMISYQWDSQDLALRLRDNLENAGFNVWMDVDKMKGNLLHAMAEAIECSASIVVCMSQKYKESLNCRSEASYAYKKKKPIIAVLVEDGYEPDGWLGLLLGMQLYYNAYSGATVKKSMPRIISEIKEKDFVKTSGGADAIDSPTLVSQQESQSHSIPPEVSPDEAVQQTPRSADAVTRTQDKQDEVREWSTEEVHQWFKDKELEELCSVLYFCDGKHLGTMYNRHMKYPEPFQTDLKSDLNLGFNTRLKFTTALEDLFKN